jgi:hypothetical protein
MHNEQEMHLWRIGSTKLAQNGYLASRRDTKTRDAKTVSTNFAPAGSFLAIVSQIKFRRVAK